MHCFNFFLPERYILLTGPLLVAIVAGLRYGFGDCSVAIQDARFPCHLLDMTSGAFHVREKHRAENSIRLLDLHRILGRVDSTLGLVSIAVTVLAIHHDRNGRHFRLAMCYLSVAGETLYLFMTRVCFMQFHTVGLLLLAVTVAIQTHVIVHFACLVNLFFVTRVFAACFIGNELGMVNCYQTAFDDLVGHFVAICTARLDHTAVGPTAALDKVAGIASFFVNSEVLISFEVAVASAA